MITCKSYFNKIQKSNSNIQLNSKCLHSPHLDLLLKHKNNLKITNPSSQPPQKKMKRTQNKILQPFRKILFLCSSRNLVYLYDIRNHSETENYTNPIVSIL